MSKKLPGMNELRLAEEGISTLETINTGLAGLLSLFECSIWPDMSSDEYDTLYNANQLLSEKIESLRKDAVSMAHKLKHITP